MNNYIFLIILSVFLVACGGGSSDAGSDNASSSSQNTVSPTGSGDEATPPATVDEVSSVSDLVVDSEFVFSTSYAIDLDVDVSERISESTYLLVCSNYEESNGEFELDYSDCIVRVHMADGKYQGQLLLPNHIQTVVASIWRFDESSEPEILVWDRGIHGESFTVR